MSLILKADAMARVISAIDRSVLIDWHEVIYQWEPLDQDTDRQSHTLGTAAMMHWWLLSHVTDAVHTRLASLTFNPKLIVIEMDDLQYTIYQDGRTTHISMI